MIYGYISPFILLIYKGIYKIFLVFVFSIIFICIMLSIDNNFFADVKDIGGKQIFKIILLF